jgi:hypothetical protein
MRKDVMGRARIPVLEAEVSRLQAENLRLHRLVSALIATIDQIAIMADYAQKEHHES